MPSATGAVGRPPSLTDDQRKALILHAAETVFEVSGYGDATMEEVARVCGMAKKTVYKIFPDKASLFGALVDSHDIPNLDGRQAINDDRPQSRLIRLLDEISSAILSPRQITLTRLVIAESVKYPELAERFYRDCVERTLEHVTQALRDDPALRLPPEIDARIIADMFVSTILGSVHLRALMLNLRREEFAEELSARISFATTMIVGAFGKR